MLASAGSAFPQNQRNAVADYGSHPNERMMELRSMNPGGEEGCIPYSYTGRIIKVKYAEDELTIIGLVILSGRNDRSYTSDGRVKKLGRSQSNNRSYVNIDEHLKLRMNRYDLGYLPTLLKEGRQIQIWANACGASGRVETADRIKALN